MSTNTNHQITLTGVGQSFKHDNKRIQLFDEVTLSIEQGLSYAITGPSGSGKSSLLMLMSGLEAPQQGECKYLEADQAKSLQHLRAKSGFIFQQFHLLPELTALNNVALPLKLRSDKQAVKKAKDWLAKVGLEHRLHHKPSQLSGGKQQRVAIARALVFSPRYIFADEPTGNLDASNAKDVAETLFTCCKEGNAALVIVTHSDSLARQADHQFVLHNGKCSPVLPSHKEASPCLEI